MDALRILCIACFLLGATWSACGQDMGVSADIGVAGWLAGCWAAGSDDRITEEQWMAPRGGMMVGMSRSVRDGASRAHEFMVIRSTESGAVFSAMPSGQTPADFSATTMTGTLLRFENPKHDFPQKIEYHRMSNERVLAKVFGEVAAAESAFDVDYRRVPCGRDGGEVVPD